MKTKLKRLDVVRTQFGTVCVVSAVSGGRVSLELPDGSFQKVAWYEPEELTLIGNITQLVNSHEHSVLDMKVG
jgi:hypothetical protein